MPNVLADFRRTHPKIKVHLFVGNTKRIVEYLNSGNIDFGIVEVDIARQKLIVEKLIVDELVVIVPPLHPWAKKKEVSIYDVIKDPFILREEGSGTRQIIEKYLNINQDIADLIHNNHLNTLWILYQFLIVYPTEN